MHVRYYQDADTQLPHIADHGVTEGEVEYILRHPGDNQAGGGTTRKITGQTAAGRYLRVICVPDDEGDGVFVITAYPIDGKALKAFRRKRKR